MAVILAKDQANFKGSIEGFFDDKNICVTGKVIEYNGKAEIIYSANKLKALFNSIWELKFYSPHFNFYFFM